MNKKVIGYCKGNPCLITRKPKIKKKLLGYYFNPENMLKVEVCGKCFSIHNKLNTFSDSMNVPYENQHYSTWNFVCYEGDEKEKELKELVKKQKEEDKSGLMKWFNDFNNTKEEDLDKFLAQFRPEFRQMLKLVHKQRRELKEKNEKKKEDEEKL